MLKLYIEYMGKSFSRLCILDVGLLGQRIYLILEDNARLFSRVVVPIYTHTSSVYGSLLVHVLSNTCHCQP